MIRMIGFIAVLLIVLILAWSFLGFLVSNLFTVGLYLYAGFCAYLSGLDKKQLIEEKIIMGFTCLIFWPFIPLLVYFSGDKGQIEFANPD